MHITGKGELPNKNDSQHVRTSKNSSINSWQKLNENPLLTELLKYIAHTPLVALRGRKICDNTRRQMATQKHRDH